MFDIVRTMQMYTETVSGKLSTNAIPETTKESAPLVLMKNYESIDEVLHTYKEPYEAAKDKKEKKKVLENFKQDLAYMLSKEYKWPERVSKAVAYFAKPEHTGQKTKLSDYLISIGFGGLPQRYAEPLAKIMKIERPLLTDVSVKYHLGSFIANGLLAYAIPELGDYIQQNLEQTLSFAGDTAKFLATAEGAILVINTGIKFIEMPYRSWEHFKNKKHVAAPSEIFDPLIIPGAIKGYLFAHNIKENIKEKIQEENKISIKEFPPKEIVDFYKDS